MATIRLVPSTYELSNTSYLTISNASNMYNNTDNTTYATVQHTRSKTSSYYCYIRGFNFDDIPFGATINSYTVKLKAYQSGNSTSTSYRPILCNGTSTYSGDYADTYIGTSVATYTFTATQDLSTFISAGSSFGIRITLRRSSSNTAAYVYIYGAEIEVNYTMPVAATVTSTLTGDGTISPSGAYSTYEDTEYTLTITPTDTSETVTVTNNGTDVTSELVAHGDETTVSAVPGSVTTSGISSGSSYMEYAVGCSAENPSSSGTSSNAYASSGSTGYAEYSFDFSGIPSGVSIESVSVSVYGHRESSTTDSTHVSSCQLYSGSTAKGTAQEFTVVSGNGNETMVISDPGTWTQSELQSAKLRHTVGYYGGLVLGATWTVVYSTGSGVTHYTYTYTVTGDATIAVTIGSSATDILYIKSNGSWVAVTTAYKKVNGTWTEQSVSSLFNSTDHFRKGD